MVRTDRVYNDLMFKTIIKRLDYRVIRNAMFKSRLDVVGWQKDDRLTEIVFSVHIIFMTRC